MAAAWAIQGRNFGPSGPAFQMGDGSDRHGESGKWGRNRRTVTGALSIDGRIHLSKIPTGSPPSTITGKPPGTPARSLSRRVFNNRFQRPDTTDTFGTRLRRPHQLVDGLRALSIMARRLSFPQRASSADGSNGGDAAMSSSTREGKSEDCQQRGVFGSTLGGTGAAAEASTVKVGGAVLIDGRGQTGQSPFYRNYSQ